MKNNLFEYDGKKMKGLDISSYMSMRWKIKYIRYVSAKFINFFNYDMKKDVFVDNNFLFLFFNSNPLMNLLLKFVSISLCLCSDYIIHPLFFLNKKLYCTQKQAHKSLSATLFFSFL